MTNNTSLFFLQIIFLCSLQVETEKETMSRKRDRDVDITDVSIAKRVKGDLSPIDHELRALKGALARQEKKQRLVFENTLDLSAQDEKEYIDDIAVRIFELKARILELEEQKLYSLSHETLEEEELVADAGTEQVNSTFTFDTFGEGGGINDFMNPSLLSYEETNLSPSSVSDYEMTPELEPSAHYFQQSHLSVPSLPLIDASQQEIDRDIVNDLSLSIGDILSSATLRPPPNLEQYQTHISTFCCTNAGCLESFGNGHDLAHHLNFCLYGYSMDNFGQLQQTSSITSSLTLDSAGENMEHQNQFVLPIEISQAIAASLKNQQQEEEEEEEKLSSSSLSLASLPSLPPLPTFSSTSRQETGEESKKNLSDQLLKLYAGSTKPFISSTIRIDYLDVSQFNLGPPRKRSSESKRESKSYPGGPTLNEFRIVTDPRDQTRYIPVVDIARLVKLMTDKADNTAGFFSNYKKTPFKIGRQMAYCLDVRGVEKLIASKRTKAYVDETNWMRNVLIPILSVNVNGLLLDKNTTKSTPIDIVHGPDEIKKDPDQLLKEHAGRTKPFVSSTVRIDYIDVSQFKLESLWRRNSRPKGYPGGPTLNEFRIVTDLRDQTRYVPITDIGRLVKLIKAKTDNTSGFFSKYEKTPFKLGKMAYCLDVHGVEKLIASKRTKAYVDETNWMRNVLIPILSVNVDKLLNKKSDNKIKMEDDDDTDTENKDETFTVSEKKQFKESDIIHGLTDTLISHNKTSVKYLDVSQFNLHYHEFFKFGPINNRVRLITELDNGEHFVPIRDLSRLFQITTETIDKPSTFFDKYYKVNITLGERRTLCLNEQNVQHFLTTETAKRYPKESKWASEVLLPLLTNSKKGASPL